MGAHLPRAGQDGLVSLSAAERALVSLLVPGIHRHLPTATGGGGGGGGGGGSDSLCDSGSEDFDSPQPPGPTVTVWSPPPAAPWPRRRVPAAHRAYLNEVLDPTADRRAVRHHAPPTATAAPRPRHRVS